MLNYTGLTECAEFHRSYWVCFFLHRSYQLLDRFIIFVVDDFTMALVCTVFLFNGVFAFVTDIWFRVVPMCIKYVSLCLSLNSSCFDLLFDLQRILSFQTMQCYTIFFVRWSSLISTLWSILSKMFHMLFFALFLYGLSERKAEYDMHIRNKHFFCVCASTIYFFHITVVASRLLQIGNSVYQKWFCCSLPDMLFLSLIFILKNKNEWWG